jgi:RNA polymerase sigma factor (sigma-70 family)
MNALNETSHIEKQLGFNLDQFDKVHQLFINWLDEKKDSQLDLILIWTYHWTRRYFIRKYLSFQINNESDLEELITKSLMKFYQNLDKLKAGHILQAWVNLLCKRVLLDYYRSDYYKFAHVPIEDEYYEFDFLDDLIIELDNRETINLVFAELSKLLPDHIIKVLEKKIIDQKSHQQIAEEMGYEVKTITNYCYKAMEKIRNSKIIIDLLIERTESTYKVN